MPKLNEQQQRDVARLIEGNANVPPMTAVEATKLCLFTQDLLRCIDDLKATRRYLTIAVVVACIGLILK